MDRFVNSQLKPRQYKDIEPTQQGNYCGHGGRAECSGQCKLKLVGTSPVFCMTRQASNNAPTKGNNEGNNLGKQASQPSSKGKKGGDRGVQLPWLRIGILFSVLLAVFAVAASSMLKGVSWAGRATRIGSLTTSFFRGSALQSVRARAGLGATSQPFSFRPLASLASVPRTNPHHQQSPLLQPTMATETVGNFDLVKRVDVSYSPVRVSKWRSRVTGLSVVHIDYEGITLILVGYETIS
jgi:hypothetical protein